MHARQPKRITSGSGLVQYRPRASPMTSTGSFAIARLLPLRLRDHPAEFGDVVPGQAPGVLEDVRDRRSAERVHHPPHHRGHHLLVRPPVLYGVEDLPLALLPD